jgi:hypothetical protein
MLISRQSGVFACLAMLAITVSGCGPAGLAAAPPAARTTLHVAAVDNAKSEIEATRTQHQAGGDHHAGDSHHRGGGDYRYDGGDYRYDGGYGYAGYYPGYGQDDYPGYGQGSHYPRDGAPRVRCYGNYPNPSYDRSRVAEENAEAFRLAGDSIWRPKCVSAPYIVEENDRAFRRAGSQIWEPK